MKDEIKYCLCGCLQPTSQKPGVLFRAGHANNWRKHNKKQVILNPVRCACGFCNEMTSGRPGVRFVKGHNRITTYKHTLKACACGCGGMTKYNYVKNHDPYHKRGRTIKEVKTRKRVVQVKDKQVKVERTLKGIRRFRELTSRNKHIDSRIELRVSATNLGDNFEKFINNETEEDYINEK